MKIDNFKIDNKDIISIAIIGSYNTEFWIKDRSDIDVVVLLDKKDDVSTEFEIEDYLLPKLQEYFNYEDIHITFLYMRDFEEDIARAYIYTANKLILDPNKEIDFRLYVNKYIRNNQWLEELIKRDTLERRGALDGTKFI